MAVITAKDSEIIFNGAKITNSTNSVTVNGISMELQAKTVGDEVINVQVTNDTEEVYNKVKDFIKEYNELLKEMNALYYAESARDYDILTSEEEEAMSDEDVEKWNDKIKGALLRRDSTLSGLLTSMKTTIHNSVEIDGEKFSLASFGISTSSDYTERGLLHLWGDEDDEYGSTKEDKLKAALEKDPGTVGKALSQMFKNMYDSLTEKTKAVDGLKSAMKFYNDKQITKELEGYTKDISSWEKKLSSMEERYYDQFTAMEVALSKMQNQSNSLASFMPQ
jgi:flagellar hook-associated protein 2